MAVAKQAAIYKALRLSTKWSLRVANDLRLNPKKYTLLTLLNCFLMSVS